MEGSGLETCKTPGRERSSSAPGEKTMMLPLLVEGVDYIPETDDEEDLPPTPPPLVRSIAATDERLDGRRDPVGMQDARKRELKRKFWEHFDVAMNARIKFSESLSDILLLVVLMYQWPIWICLLFVMAFRVPLILQRQRQFRVL